MYQVASTSVAKGLNPGYAILAVFVGHTLVCIPAMLDGYVGAKLGINFPVYCRSAFGMRGSYAAVFIRGIVAVIWFGPNGVHSSFETALADEKQARNLSKEVNVSKS